MNTRLYSLFDKKVKTYGRVDVFTCDAVAIRCYLRYLQDDALHFNDFVSFPEDFNLVCVGEFNHDTGLVTTFDAPILVASLSDLKALLKNEEK